MSKVSAEQEGARQVALQSIIDAPRGTFVRYYIGHLAFDADVTNPNEQSRARFAGIRAGAWEAYERGFCALVQRRVGINNFEYIAQRT